jgi:hypothetical protein
MHTSHLRRETLQCALQIAHERRAVAMRGPADRDAARVFLDRLVAERTRRAVMTLALMMSS